jgi:hypothetical protein
MRAPAIRRVSGLQFVIVLAVHYVREQRILWLVLQDFIKCRKLLSVAGLVSLDFVSAVCRSARPSTITAWIQGFSTSKCRLYVLRDETIRQLRRINAVHQTRLQKSVLPQKSSLPKGHLFCFLSSLVTIMSADGPT